MPIGDLCRAQVAVVRRSASVAEAARLMRERHVGDVVVCDLDKAERDIPIGILTDRDIVVGLIAKDVSISSICVEDAMTPTLVTIEAQKGVFETIQLMEKYGVRRLPVVGPEGELVGIVSSVDLLELLSKEFASLSRLAELQQTREREMRL